MTLPISPVPSAWFSHQKNHPNSLPEDTKDLQDAPAVESVQNATSRAVHDIYGLPSPHIIRQLPTDTAEALMKHADNT